MWSVLKRSGVIRRWKWWETRERCFSGVDCSEVVWEFEFEEVERKEKMMRRTSSQSDVRLRGGLNMIEWKILGLEYKFEYDDKKSWISS
jgi:hypothetical protein